MVSPERIQQMKLEVARKLRNPMAPLIIEQAHVVIGKTASLFVGATDKAKIQEMSDHLLSAFPEEMDGIAASPEFITAVCVLLSESLVQFAANANK